MTDELKILVGVNWSNGNIERVYMTKQEFIDFIVQNNHSTQDKIKYLEREWETMKDMQKDKQ